MKIAIISLDQIWKNKEENLKKCLELIALSCKEKVDCIIFPELTLTGFCFDDSSLFEEIDSSKTIKFFEKESQSRNICIIFGSLLIENSKKFNTFCVSQPNTKTEVAYKKINTFKQAGEDIFVTKGNEIKLFEFNKIKFLPGICFDLRFPLHFLSLAKYCDAGICIANWPKIRINHWHTLLKARAIENQMYMIGVNRIGKDGKGLEYIESSSIYNPMGELINPYLVDNNIKFFDINFEFSSKFRKEFNCLSIINPQPYLKNSNFLKNKP